MRYSKSQQKCGGVGGCGVSKQKSVSLGFHLPVEATHQQKQTFFKNSSRVISGMFNKMQINRVIC